MRAGVVLLQGIFEGGDRLLPVPAAQLLDARVVGRHRELALRPLHFVAEIGSLRAGELLFAHGLEGLDKLLFLPRPHELVERTRCGFGFGPRVFELLLRVELLAQMFGFRL